MNTDTLRSLPGNLLASSWHMTRSAVETTANFGSETALLALEQVKQQCCCNPSDASNFAQCIKENPGMTIKALGNASISIYDSTPVAIVEGVAKRAWNGYCVANRLMRNVEMCQKRNIVKRGKLSSQITRELFNIRLEMIAHTLFAAAGTAQLTCRFHKSTPAIENAIISSNCRLTYA